ncbi:MAG: hypothetical protein ABSA44_08495 [Bacteroidota bacterium]|jgi:hypothetical protein
MKKKVDEHFIQLFSALYSTEDILAFLIRGHLYCEASLTELLSQHLKNKTEINIDRLDYSVKINLCSALGLIPVMLKPGLQHLGVIRNKYVHNLNYSATEQDQLDFLNTIRSTMGEPAEDLFSRNTKFPNGFRRCVMALWIPLQMALAGNESEFRDIRKQIVAAATSISVLYKEDSKDQGLKRIIKRHQRTNKNHK